MGCAINKEGKVEEHMQNGLLQKHAYGIIDVAKIKFKDNSVEEIMVIRNPHG